MKRRTFVRKSLQSGLVISAIPILNYCGDTSSTLLPKRKLGRTGEELSIIGFGGILVMNETTEESARRVSLAIDMGCNYFDVAPSYGNAEEMLGPAFEPYRKDCFLACKTTRRDAEGAEQELNESLRKMRTDYFDLYQLHALSSIEDVEQCFAPGGAMEPILKAREAGKIRFLGFSAHSQEAALLAMDLFDFDSILFPINYMCMEKGKFGPGALSRAKEKGPWPFRVSLMELPNHMINAGTCPWKMRQCPRKPLGILSIRVSPQPSLRESINSGQWLLILCDPD